MNTGPTNINSPESDTEFILLYPYDNEQFFDKTLQRMVIDANATGCYGRTNLLTFRIVRDHT